MKTGLLLFAHGSSVEAANQSVHAAAEQLRGLGGWDEVAVSFLELAEPTLPQAVDLLAAKGVRRVLVVPYFLTLGIHLQRDLPSIIAQARQTRSDLEIQVAPPLEGHPALIEALRDRAAGLCSGKGDHSDGKAD